MPSLALQYGPQFVLFAFVGFFTFHPFVDLLSDRAACFLGQPSVLDLQFNAFIQNAENGPVHRHLSEFFYNVKYQAGFAGAVGMQKPA